MPTFDPVAFFKGVGIVLTNPTLLGIIAIVAVAVWLLRGAWDKRRVEIAESARDLYNDRYVLEKDSHDALKLVTKEKDQTLATQAEAIARGPKEMRDLVVRLSHGEKIQTAYNPADIPTSVLVSPAHFDLKIVATLANASASGLAKTITVPSGGYSSSASSEVVTLGSTGMLLKGAPLIIDRPGNKDGKK